MQLKQEVSLRPLTTIGIGGAARELYLCSTVSGASRSIKETGGDFYILGRGSNLLIKDSLIRKPVIKLGVEFSYIKKDGQYFEVGAATPLAVVMRYCIENGLSGLEGLAGIPATIGGMVVMNAGAFSTAISSLVEAVEVIDNSGSSRRISAMDIAFGYRRSSLRAFLVVRVWLRLSPGKNIKEKIRGFLARRLSLQDFDFPSCGCIFKNPPNFSAGFLIDSCGLKGLRRNDARISPRHGNFIINLRSATYNDVHYLIETARERVNAKHRINLEEEIQRWQ